MELKIYFDMQKSRGLLVGYFFSLLDEKGPLRCDGYLEQDLSDMYCLLGQRIDKTDREYYGLIAAKGIKVIVPRMNRLSVPNRNMSQFFLQSTIQKSKWKK